MPPKIKRVGKYDLGITLGQGTFGKVKIAIDTTSNTSVAIKMLDKNKIREARMGSQIKKEIRVMKMLNHPTCIRLIEVLASKTTIFIVSELVTGGELFDRIVTDGKFDQESARKYFKQLMDGLEHCHSMGICHRDLKPENLLLDAKGGLKITDFGLSSFNENKNEHQLLHTACGTPNYVAPEVLMEKGYDGECADVWSAGVILYVMMAGFLPFDEAQMVDLFRKIVCADFQYPSWMSPEAQSLISRMLEPDPDRRASIEEIKSSAFYRGLSRDELELEDDVARGPTRTGRRLSMFFDTENNELFAEMLEKHVSAPMPYNVNLSKPIEVINKETFTVTIDGQEMPIVDWFNSKYQGHRSVAPLISSKPKSKKRVVKTKAIMKSITHSNSQDNSSDNNSNSLAGSLAELTLLNPSLSESTSSQLLNQISNLPATPSGPGSGITLSGEAICSSLSPSDGALSPVVGSHDIPVSTLSAVQEEETEHEGNYDNSNACEGHHNDHEATYETNQQDQDDDERTGPRPLNAFDLINMVSGQSMNNMLLFNKGTPQQGQPSFTQFTSRHPTDVLMARIDYVLLNNSQLRYRICYRKCQVSLVWTSPKNHRIGVHIEIYHLTPELHMIQCKRMHGSILAHHEFYKRFRDQVKSNETSVEMDTIRHTLATWDADYAIFSEARHRMKQQQQLHHHHHHGHSLNSNVVPTAQAALTEVTAPSQTAHLNVEKALVNVISCSTTAIPNSTSNSNLPVQPITKSSLHTNISIRGVAGGGLSTMHSLTAGRPARQQAESSSSSDDEDDDSGDESDSGSSVASTLTQNSMARPSLDSVAQAKRINAAHIALNSLKTTDDHNISMKSNLSSNATPVLTRVRSNSSANIYSPKPPRDDSDPHESTQDGSSSKPSDTSVNIL